MDQSEAPRKAIIKDKTINENITAIPDTNHVSAYILDFMALLKETHNSFKKWPLNLWWISNRTFNKVGNIAKAAIF